MLQGLASARTLFAKMALGVTLAVGIALPALTPAEAAPGSMPAVLQSEGSVAEATYESVGYYHGYYRPSFRGHYYHVHRPFYRRCFVRQQRIWTYHGWVYRNVRVCR